MEIADFEFKRERKLGEFVQDFVNLLKLISGHLSRVMMKLLLVPICLMVLMVYYISTQINMGTDFYGDQFTRLFENILFTFLLLVVVGLVAFGFGTEYFMLLRNNRNLEFTAKDVFRAFMAHIGRYLKFLLTAAVVSILAFIPIAIVAGIGVFIPIVGSIAVGVFFTMVSIWYFTAFMLYREGYYDSFNAFRSALRILRKKIFSYGLATYVIHFIFQALLMLMGIVPAIVFFVISYNSGNFSYSFFEGFYGRILISMGGSLITVVTLMYYVLSVLSYGIVYETAKELNYGENIFDRIDKLGKEVERG